MNPNQRSIEQALSLREPQKESLELLAKVVDKISLSDDMDINEALALIQEIAPTVRNFERSFPSICFSIATGVGKTRLMGAFIAYLYLEKGIRNFFVLAPNLTIYNKLVTDFTPNTPKYVFPGISDFAITPPLIITGDNYSQVGDLLDRGNDDRVRINIFNISKIDSDKDSATGLPRIRRMAEYLGQSYFDYLANLDDLVIIMDEAHRYKAKAGMAAINELKAVLGIELTATAKSTGAKGTRFQNVIYDYPLAKAIHDGYVKKPAIVGRSDFKEYMKNYSAEDIEHIKIKDGLRIHEEVRAELEVYSDNYKQRKVKPFLMIIAKNVEHAEELHRQIQSTDFEGGRYIGKSLVVHSGQSGELKDDVLQNLLNVEKADNPIEIVIHVNMLGEGWDVNNLYTIVPLRTADSKILVEQSIGRGLRLPYGKITGHDTVDRLHIIAHDKFNEIVEAAQREEFEFQKIEIDTIPDLLGKKAVENYSRADMEIFKEIAPKMTQGELPVKIDNKTQEIMDVTRDVIEDLSKIMLSSKDLLTPENKARVVEEVKRTLQASKPQGELGLESTANVDLIIIKTLEKDIDISLDIPRIKIEERPMGNGFTFKHFDLDVTPLSGFSPVPQKVIVQDLTTKITEQKGEAEFEDIYENAEEYLLVPLFDFDAINQGTERDLIYHLVEQAVAHIRTYTKNETELRKILFYHGKTMSKIILDQLLKHFVPAEREITVHIHNEFVSLHRYKILESENYPPVSFRNHISNKTDIRNMTFDGFKKCLFAKQKFDSDTERALSVILEDEPSVIKWFKINDERAKEIFGLKYEDPQAHSMRGYCPDFVLETNAAKYIIETKSAKDMTSEAVQSKKRVTEEWCKNASDFEKKNGGKPWTYLLVPHDTLIADRSFAKIVEDWKVK